MDELRKKCSKINYILGFILTSTTMIALSASVIALFIKLISTLF